MFFELAIPDALTKGFLLTAIVLLWVILLVRIVGLRSFSKMTNIDFVMTIAMGSLTAAASQVGNWIDLSQVLAAIAALFALQFTIAFLRKRSDSFRKLIQNTPVLLMSEGVILQDALRKTRVSEVDLIAKLREANVTDMTTVRAVVLETTGDVSVLTGGEIDPQILEDVTQV